MHLNRFPTLLANAVAALEAADTKIGKALAAFEDGSLRNLYGRDLWNAQMASRTFARLLSQSDGEPDLPDRVIRKLVRHVNDHSRNPRDLEGALLCLALAERMLDEALDAGDFEDVSDELAMIAGAAVGSIGQFKVLLRSNCFGTIGLDDMIDDLVGMEAAVAA